MELDMKVRLGCKTNVARFAQDLASVDKVTRPDSGRASKCMQILNNLCESNARLNEPTLFTDTVVDPTLADLYVYQTAFTLHGDSAL